MNHAETSSGQHEHRQILDAIVRRDADRAEQLGASHTNLARKRVTEYISQSAIGTMSLQDVTGNAGVALSLPL
ncbi:FCD domain-containing protein [Cupriavidus sp. DL-D2]|uniref:FCD domain-containing protein n=1 Tax=Cupriavidus sp. DL-D2 TaxID=3144974 RepID=UPI003213F929